MSTAADYQNRTFDLLAFTGWQSRGTNLLTQQIIPPDSGEICAGITKLAQRWVLKFLTPLGSMPFLPQQGCNFVNQITGFTSEFDVTSAFQFAAVMIAQQMLAEEPATLVPDEQYASVSLLGITLQPGQLSLSINIVSQAGDSREVLLPIDLLPAPLGV